MVEKNLGQLYVEERRAAILEVIEKSSTASVADLARAFEVSAVTIRQDLDALDKLGKIRRTHGGAVSLSRHISVSVQDQRFNMNAEAKAAIAKRARELVHPGDYLFVDSGTTAIELVKELRTISHLTIVTADLTVADLVDQSLPEAELILLGGSVRKAHRYVAGSLTEDMLSRLHVNTAFICPGALAPKQGFLTEFEAMGAVKRAAIQCADTTYVLMDSSKIDGRGLICFASLDEVDALIIEKSPRAAQLARELKDVVNVIEA